VVWVNQPVELQARSINREDGLKFDDPRLKPPIVSNKPPVAGTFRGETTDSTGVSIEKPKADVPTIDCTVS
jgi:hypothetical protein